MALTITEGFTWGNGNTVMPTRLNKAVRDLTIQMAASKLLGTTGAGNATEIGYTATGLSVLQAADKSAGRTALGVAIGADVQAYSAALDLYAGISPSANVQSFLGAANYAAMRALVLPGYKETIDGSTDGWGGFSSGGPLRTSRSSTALSDAVVFYNPNGNVGAIYTDGSTTTYNTVSDRRLKRNIAPAPECGERLDRVQVREFEFASEPGRKHRGFIAQELSRCFPDAVVRGSRKRAWMVDASKLIPALVQEVQSLRRRVAELERKK